ncbi:LysE family translocator [Nocardioides sp.]|uniref:LysE family translocator n=1 Tax=Nocardioides sp. TaxID=35761 RepID=UPI0035B4805B
MALSTAAAFWAVSFLFVITPGADWAYVMTAGHRHRTIVPAISGLLTGHLAATAVVAAGLAAVFAASPTMMTTMTLSGAAYLVWLGVGMLRSESVALSPEASSDEVSGARQALLGLGVSGLNPKVFLLFLALLPQFVDAAAAWAVPVQIFALGFIHMASCAVVYTIVGVGARHAVRARPATARTLTRVSGSAMIAIGLLIVAEQSLT